MKTCEQVLAWLKAQEWFPQYMRNLSAKFSPKEIELWNRDHFDGLAISGAFEWGNTPEGFDFWANVARKFDHWYNKR